MVMYCRHVVYIHGSEHEEKRPGDSGDRVHGEGDGGGTVSGSEDRCRDIADGGDSALMSYRFMRIGTRVPRGLPEWTLGLGLRAGIIELAFDGQDDRTDLLQIRRISGPVRPS